MSMESPMLRTRPVRILLRVLAENECPHFFNTHNEFFSTSTQNIDIGFINFYDLSSYLTRGQCYKISYNLKLRIFVISYNVRASQGTILCLHVRQELTQVKHLPGAPLSVRLLDLPTNNRQGWKGLSEANTLAYYENS